MKIYGLLGNPLGHSFSQKYFTEKFFKEDIANCTYLNFETPELEREIPRLQSNLELCGLNVTIPYKSKILAFLEGASPECKAIEACNCIRISDQKWVGFNTDIIGFQNTFTPHLEPHHKKALILGTGGSSKAVAYVLEKLGIDYLFVSRNTFKNKNIAYEDITSSILNEFNIVINTTPVGMFPNVKEYPKLPYNFVCKKHYFFDLIYNPQKTLFLSLAEERGAIIENGEKMLIIQAEESWKIWNEKTLT
ncbi:MAG: shikimate dehydrogenase [Ginsengibacter sp.]